MDPVISSSVPPPSRQRVRDHIRALEPGQSVFFPAPLAKHPSIRSAAYYVAIESRGKFTTAVVVVDGVVGVRVWRLKSEGESNGTTETPSASTGGYDGDADG